MCLVEAAAPAATPAKVIELQVRSLAALKGTRPQLRRTPPPFPPQPILLNLGLPEAVVPAAAPPDRLRIPSNLGISILKVPLP